MRWDKLTVRLEVQGADGAVVGQQRSWSWAEVFDPAGAEIPSEVDRMIDRVCASWDEAEKIRDVGGEGGA